MQKLQGWVEKGGVTVTTSGVSSSNNVQGSYISATVTVYNAGTLTLSTIYSDNGITPKANPFTADATGYWFFYAANARYDVTFSGGGLTTPFTLSDYLLQDLSGGGITSLNGLTATTQTFATGTGGTDFAISSSSSTHTFSLPTASGSVRGALSSADWTTFNAKQATLTFNSPLNKAGTTVSLNTVPIASGGTGQTTATLAMDALSPQTTKGDLIGYDGSNVVRVPVGTNNYGLVADSTQTAGIKWAAVATSPVSVANGGTGLTTLTGVPYGSGTSALTPVVASNQLQVFRRQANVSTTAYEFATPPWINASDFNFSAQTPGGSLSAGVGASVTLSPVPLGVNGSDTGHYLYISGGTGAAEAVLITGGSATSGASSGTVTFTPGNNHTGAWTITSATQGIQEALSYLPIGNNGVIVPTGTSTLNANVSYGGKTNAAIVLAPGAVLAGTGTLPSSTSGLNYILDERTKPALFTQTASVTVANTTTETTLVGSGVGSMTLPANFLTVGRVLKVRVWGVHSATGAPTIRIKVKVGGTAILDTTAVTSNNDTNTAFQVEAWITCRTTGGTGTIIGQGKYEEISHAAFPMSATATTTVDTTATQAVDVSLTWGTAAAGNTQTATNLVLECVQ